MKKWLSVCLIVVMLLGPLVQPSQVDAASPILFTEVVSYNQGALALDQAGHIWAWGTNRGKYGDGSTSENNLPRRISVLENGSEVQFEQLETQYYNSYALDVSGHIWVTGSNAYGQLGISKDTTELLVWTKLDIQENGTAVTFTKVDAARRALGALDSNGYIWEWGGEYGNIPVPTKRIDMNGATRIRFEDISMIEVTGFALDENKQIWKFYDYQSLAEPSSLSVMESGSNVRFKTISNGDTDGIAGNFAVAIDEGGDLWTWGTYILEYKGELGNGDHTGAIVPLPTRISVSDNGSPVKFKQVHAGNKYVLAIDTSNTIWTWGHNNSGQLGDGTTNNQYVPHKLPVSYDGSPVQFQSIYGYQGTSYAIDTSGRVWAWGAQQSLGLGLTGLQTTPTRFYLQPSITLTRTPNSSTFLQQVTLKATITGAYSTPTGTIVFKDGATVLGSASLSGSGEAQLNVSNLAVGSHSLTATYSGNDIYMAKATGDQTHTVSMPAMPDIQITPSTTANTAGPITLAVAVQANGSGNSIVSTKWLAGTQNVSAFAGAGGTNVSGGSFQVSNGGAYTVYAKDSAGNEKVSVFTVTNINSEISPATASFDKYAGATGYLDVTTTMTLKGNTLTSIQNGAATLTAGSNYTVSGNNVTIGKSYLAAQSTGTTTLTLSFSGGATKTLAVSVSDSTPSISPTTASFDKYTGASGYADVTTTMTLNGYTLTSIQNGAATLAAGSNYSVSGNSVTIQKAYLAEQLTGTTTLTLTFSGGATKTLAVTVSDSTPSITPMTASFDKYTGASGYADVTTTMTLNGDTLTSIQNGAATLAAGSNYTVSGNSVTIQKAYLAEQLTGTTTLTLTFSGGATTTLAVTVSDSTPSITPMTASFDKYTGASGYADVTTTMTLNGHTLTSIQNGAATLAAGSNYMVSGNTVTIQKSYLATQSNGTTMLTLTFSGGATKTLEVAVSDSTPSISPTTASFDKYTGASGYADVTTTMTLNGHTLTSIQNGAATLAAGSNYTVSGNTVTIQKAYLAAQPSGTTTLTLTFSGGATTTLALTVSDSTPSISPTAASFDKYSGSLGHVDIATELMLNSDTLVGISNNGEPLTAEIDYTVSGSTVTIATSYLATQPTGTTNITLAFSGGATQTLAVAVSDTTPSISMMTASYDRYTGSLGHLDITTAMTLHNDTLVSLTNDGVPLTIGMDYTSIGSTVTITRSYLAEQSVGTTSLTFTFSGGATQLLAVAVDDSTPSLTPTTARFDRYAHSLSHVDVSTELTLHSDSLVNISNSGTLLTPGIDYTVNGTTVTIAASYLAAQPAGTTSLTFTFSGGATQTLAVTFNDTTPSVKPTYRIEEDSLLGVILHIDASMLVTHVTPDGTTVQKVRIPDIAITEAANLLARAAHSQLIIRVDTASDIQVELSGGAMELILKAAPGAMLQVMGKQARMELQASGFDLASLAKLMGVAVADLKIVTTMKQVNDDIVKQLKQVGVVTGFHVVGTPIDFQVHIEANGQIKSIRDMGGTYLVRAIIHNADTEPGHVLAVYFDPATGSVVPVPNKRIMREDGQVEVEMQAPNNRIYSMVSTTKRSFADLQGHWSQQDVELLASNLIVNGVSKDQFAPDVRITRAEFASLLVRSLGMSLEKDQAYRGFADVASDAWYALAVEAASKAGLVNGISATKFAPHEPITREQMAVMIARAQILVRTLQVTPDGAEDAQLQTFTDMQKISPWALEAVDEMVASGIMNGLDPTQFAPAELATRAQAATILKRFMQNVGFIDG